MDHSSQNLWRRISESCYALDCADTILPCQGFQFRRNNSEPTLSSQPQPPDTHPPHRPSPEEPPVSNMTQQWQHAVHARQQRTGATSAGRDPPAFYAVRSEERDDRAKAAVAKSAELRARCQDYRALAKTLREQGYGTRR